MLSLRFKARKPPKRPIASPITDNKGTIKLVASMRVTTRYWRGLAPETSIASNCSVTFMLPNSAPMLEAILPAQMIPMITGPISLTKETESVLGSILAAPNATSVGLSCNISTTPIMNDVIPTSIIDR